MRFHSTPIEEHAEVPLADDGRWERLVETFKTRDHTQRAAREGGNACFVVSVHDSTGDASIAAQLEEISGLVEAQGDRVVGQVSQRLVKPDPRTLLRRGVAERIGEQAREQGADMLVIDAELSPSQTRNLEDVAGLPICDREAVILNVFERHAKTQRARIQVEIAHLQYLRPRIRGIGLNMDQQAGGIMGGRGPGETASELFARRIDGRLADLRRGLAQLARSDRAQRKHRAQCARVALVGYTNAGKTSLMNALTDAGLSARDRPFETLDTTSRCLTRHGQDVLLSDTVGFIRRLPERLFASFESTLAEVCEASLLLLVLDASDPELSEHLHITEAVLERLGACEVPRLIVFNKLDRLSEDCPEAAATINALGALAGAHPYLALSSRDAEAVAQLRMQILERVRAKQRTREVFVRYEQQDIARRIYESCRVVHSQASERGTQFVIEGQPHVVDAIARDCRRRG
ncbi:MAG: GTPase HflX [Myxococcales bacterium]|nr:GTPase HflX [Myxococcales bacterium]